jgi:hypothetical protein
MPEVIPAVLWGMNDGRQARWYLWIFRTCFVASMPYGAIDGGLCVMLSAGTSQAMISEAVYRTNDDERVGFSVYHEPATIGIDMAEMEGLIRAQRRCGSSPAGEVKELMREILRRGTFVKDLTPVD